MKCVKSFFIRLLAVIIASGSFFIPWQTALPAHASEIGLADPVNPGKTISLPARFEQNVGQAAPDVLYYGRSQGLNVEIKQDSAILKLTNKNAAASISLKPIGANSSALVIAENELVTKTNYLTSRDTNSWLTGIKNFGNIRYQQVYPNIDLVYYGNDNKLEYDFEVAPGANPSLIRMAVSGADTVSLENGALNIKTTVGTLVEQPPVAYQETPSGRLDVAAAFVLADQTVSFSVGTYDPALPLIIDPVLAYSTFVGGDGGSMDYDDVRNVATDLEGYSYVAGNSRSVNIISAPPPQPTFLPADNLALGNDVTGNVAFVLKIDPWGSNVVYATYIGGSTYTSPEPTSSSWVRGLTIDASGNAYVAGITNQTNFPVTSGTLKTVCGCGAPGTPGNQVPDAYVLQLSVDGSAINFGTFLGGSNSESVAGIKIDESGNIYIAGTAASADFPTTPDSYQPVYADPGGSDQNSDGYIAKLNPTATSFIYSTFVGNQYYDEITSFGIDAAGNVYFAGFTGTNASGEGYMHAAALNAAGNALLYDYQIQGSGNIRSEAVDAAGNAYLAGFIDCRAPTFAPTPGVFQPNCAGRMKNGFIIKLNPSGALIYATFLGGTYIDEIYSIAIDPEGNAYVTGSACSSDFPVRNAPYGTHSTNLPSGQDAFLSKITPDASLLEYSTYVGGSIGDQGFNISVDPSNNIYVAGFTGSDDFPTTAGVFSPTMRGGYGDGFLMKMGASDSLTLAPGSQGTVSIPPEIAGEAGITATVTNNNSLASAGKLNMATGTPGEITVTVERLGLNKKSDTTTMDIGGQLVDLQILGADSSDKVNTSFYLPSNLTDSQINNLTLTYIDTSGHTKKVKTSGNKNPTKIKQKNVDGTKSAGKVTVVFDATSSPVASALPGTVFASLNSVPSNLYQLQSNVNDLNLPALDAKAANLLLQSTMEALARGKNVLAVNQMKLFVAYINLLVKIKHLTAGQAAEITDYAQSIIANIPSFTPGAQAWQDAKAQINALITATNALRAMPSGQKKSLVERLNSAISALSGGKQANGVANLTAFKAAVASGVAKGWLTASEAANLQAGAQAAIDLINSTPAYPPPPPPPAPPVPPPSPEPGS